MDAHPSRASKGLRTSPAAARISSGNPPSRMCWSKRVQASCTRGNLLDTTAPDSSSMRRASSLARGHALVAFSSNKSLKHGPSLLEGLPFGFNALPEHLLPSRLGKAHEFHSSTSACCRALSGRPVLCSCNSGRSLQARLRGRRSVPLPMSRLRRMLVNVCVDQDRTVCLPLLAG